MTRLSSLDAVLIMRLHNELVVVLHIGWEYYSTFLLHLVFSVVFFFFFSSRRRHTRCSRDWSSDVCSSDLQRTLAIVQSDGHTVQPYTPPSGWSVDDFAVHPSGDISAILTTATDVRIVRLDPNGSIRSDQLFLDPSSPTDPRSEEHTSELQSRLHLVCRLLLEKK